MSLIFKNGKPVGLGPKAKETIKKLIFQDPDFKRTKENVDMIIQFQNSFFLDLQDQIDKLALHLEASKKLSNDFIVDLQKQIHDLQKQVYYLEKELEEKKRSADVVDI